MTDLDAKLDAACKGIAALDDLLRHPIRLAVCVLLGGVRQMNFSRLSDLVGATDGNLGANLQNLEQAGYIEVRKKALGARSASWYRLTRAGRLSLTNHLGAMEAIVRNAKERSRE